MTETKPLLLPSPQPELYEAAYNGAVMYSWTACGRLRMGGRDRAALLHRLSTNQIEALRPGQGTETVITTPIGRIIDLLSVFCFEQELLLVSSPRRGAALAQHLRKNIFFNDQVTVEDAGASLDQLSLYGPQAAALLTTAGLPGAELPAQAIASATWRDHPLLVARTRALGGAGFWLFGAPEHLAALADQLSAAGVPLLDDASYTVLRVEHGHPAYGQELSPTYIPLETGLWGAVSFSKGCYVGQEIIARMESRGRLAKQLRGLSFDQLPTLTAGATPLAQLEVEGKTAGDLTSLVVSPKYGLIGLAYVRTAYAERGTRLIVAGAPAMVVDLPWS